MNTFSKSILLTVLLVYLSFPAIVGSPPAVTGCTSTADVGNPCTFQDGNRTCMNSGGDHDSTLTCCNIEVQSDEGGEVLECRCCLDSDQCEQCDELE
ncbi:unnamed protein product [Orchesella dallaii]|uniref:Uncharacterized protein n=1 Tax=Orchesella dallaii TaxID=48710 RepID=A0ABP1PI82_9HEXA